MTYELTGNHAYNVDCMEALKELPDESIDLTVTSPPYDNLRDYHGYVFDWKATIRELPRITKNGGGGRVDCFRSNRERERNWHVIPSSPVRYGVRV